VLCHRLRKGALGAGEDALGTAMSLKRTREGIDAGVGKLHPRYLRRFGQDGLKFCRTRITEPQQSSRFFRESRNNATASLNGVLKEVIALRKKRNGSGVNMWSSHACPFVAPHLTMLRFYHEREPSFRARRRFSMAINSSEIALLTSASASPARWKKHARVL
jgi:hypothetical protein